MYNLIYYKLLEPISMLKLKINLLINHNNSTNGSINGVLEELFLTFGIFFSSKTDVFLHDTKNELTDHSQQNESLILNQSLYI
jgi:hypothetical protein